MGTEEITGSADIINRHEVTARIANLKPWKVTSKDGEVEYFIEEFADQIDANNYISELPGSHPDDYEAIEWDEEADELAGLRMLNDVMAGHGGNTCVIREDYMVTLVKDEADDHYGINEASALFDYIDWARLAKNRAENMTPIVFRGTTYRIEPR